MKVYNKKLLALGIGCLGGGVVILARGTYDYFFKPQLSRGMHQDFLEYTLAMLEGLEHNEIHDNCKERAAFLAPYKERALALKEANNPNERKIMNLYTEVRAMKLHTFSEEETEVKKEENKKEMIQNEIH